jgi:hypothetical protein
MRAQHPGDGRRQPFPAGALGLQLPAPCRGQAVELRPLFVLGDLPLGVNPPLALEAVKRRVERAMIDVEDVLRGGSQSNADAVTMLRSVLQRSENEEIKRALEKVRLPAAASLGHR